VVQFEALWHAGWHFTIRTPPHSLFSSENSKIKTNNTYSMNCRPQRDCEQPIVLISFLSK